MSCHKLEFFSLIFYVKEGKHWKVSLMETFRMIFSLHAGVTPPIPITSFYVIVIIKWLLVALVPGEASVIEKQPSILLITSILKIKINSKTFQFFINSTKTLKMANLYWGKDLFTIRHSLWGRKTYLEQPHLASACFVKVFHKMTTCPKQPLLSGPKSDCLIQVVLYSPEGIEIN